MAGPLASRRALDPGAGLGAGKSYALPCLSLFGPVFAALNAAEVRYVIVGGLATVLHGFARLTADIDLVIDLEPEPAKNAMRTFADLGLKARAPVALEAFADPGQRARWVSEKGMKVFSLWDSRKPMLEIDLFVEHPIPFSELWDRSELIDLEDSQVRIAGLSDLIALKRLAGRAQDLQDIEALEAILKGRAP
jgi:Nucleotidyltransferase of unknown function (DUF6036)